MSSIGLRYCGGYNPQIDRSRVAKEFKKDLSTMDLRVDFTTEKERPIDITLLINGCMHACLEEECLREVDSPQFISVKGEMVGRQYVKEDNIPKFLIKTIVDLLNSSSY